MTTEQKPTEKRGIEMMTKIKIILALIIAIFVLILIFQNIDPVPTQVLWGSFDVSHALLLFIMLLVGFGAGVLVTGITYRKRSKR